jgi:hypothetical protein
VDPEACLEACRRLAAQLIRRADEGRQHHESTYEDTLGEELAENFNNLDEWIQKGGFLPSSWRRT